MQISVKPVDSDSPNIATLHIPVSDFSLDSGLRLIIEMINAKGVILDRQSVALKLPNFFIDGKEVAAIPYLKAKILEHTKMQKIPTPAQVPAIALPNWSGALEAIRGTELFGKVWSLAKTNTAVQAAFTLIYNSLTSVEPSTADFYFGLSELQNTMGANLTSADVDTINRVLKANNFDFQL